MRKFVFFALFLLTIAISAQDEYQLRQPGVEAYMQAVPAIVERASALYDDIRLNISQEFNLRYGDINLADLPFALLLDFQTALAIGGDPFLSLDEREWFMAMLNAGFRDESINDFSGEFVVGNFHIIPLPVDFDGDGVNEYLLEIHDDWSWRNFYALVSNTIQLIPLPITGLFSDTFTRGKAETGELLTRVLGDLDNEGKTEWIVEGNDYGYWASCGDLYVMDWQNGELVDRTGDLFSYCLPMAQFDTASAEFDYDQPDAIQMIEMRVDGWNCQCERRDTLSLIDDTLNTVTIYADTVWCMLREAGDAFDKGDYETAADIYREVISEFDGQMTQYLYARLALADALGGQVDAAQATLDSVEPDGQMGDLILRLQAVSDQPEAMCRAAYDFFAETNRREDEWENPYEWTPEKFHFGHDPDDPRYFPLPMPSQAGCDYPQAMGIESTPIFVANTIPDPHYFVRNGAYLHLMRGEYHDALAQIDTMLASPETENYAPQLAYWRALTLELMGRTDDALAEYIALYESAPDSAWGMLAALHFEAPD